MGAGTQHSPNGASPLPQCNAVAPLVLLPLFLVLLEPLHEIPATTKDMEEVSSSGPRFKGLFVCLFPHSLG